MPGYDYSKWEKIDVSDSDDEAAALALESEKPVSDGYPGPGEEETELTVPACLQEKASHDYPEEGGYKQFVKSHEPTLQKFASLPASEAGDFALRGHLELLHYPHHVRRWMLMRHVVMCADSPKEAHGLLRMRVPREAQQFLTLEAATELIAEHWARSRASQVRKLEDVPYMKERWAFRMIDVRSKQGEKWRELVSSRSKDYLQQVVDLAEKRRQKGERRAQSDPTEPEPPPETEEEVAERKAKVDRVMRQMEAAPKADSRASGPGRREGKAAAATAPKVPTAAEGGLRARVWQRASQIRPEGVVAALVVAWLAALAVAVANLLLSRR